MIFPSTYDGLAEAYAAIGQIDKAHDILREYVINNPDIATGYSAQADFLALAGRFDEAAAAYARARGINPSLPRAAGGARNLNAITERWADVEAFDRSRRDASDSMFRWRGAINLGLDALHRGRSVEAVRWFEEAVASGTGSSLSARAGAFLASALLVRDQPAPALERAQRAFAESHDTNAKWRPLLFAGIAQGRLQRPDDAAKTLALLSELAADLPSD